MSGRLEGIVNEQLLAVQIVYKDNTAIGRPNVIKNVPIGPMNSYLVVRGFLVAILMSFCKEKWVWLDYRRG